LRARLVGAFILLIVSSASATIIIGNIVFGSKVVEMGHWQVESGGRVGELVLGIWSDRLGQRALMGSNMLQAGQTEPDLCATVLEKRSVVDFALVKRNQTVTLVRTGDAAPKIDKLFSSQGPVDCVHTPIPDFVLSASPLQEVADFAHERQTPASGLIVIGKETLAGLGYPSLQRKQGLLLAGAAEFDGGRSVLIVGTLLDGRSDFVAAPLQSLWPHHGAEYVATLFLGTTPVSSTQTEVEPASTIDPGIAERILKDGRPNVGPTQLPGGNYYAAYTPLVDIHKKPVAVLSIAALESIHSDIRNRTIALFSSLIAAGMIFGFIMTYVFAGWLIRPVKELAEGMNKVAKGDLDYKVRFSSSDELGRLANAFNVMVKHVKERDIRLREMTEERLSRVEKQVSIGRLAAGVAHEINNPLTSVLSLSMLALKHLPPNDPRREDLEVVVEETTRCRDIVKSLLDFAREGPVEKRKVDLNRVIQDTLVLTSRYEGMSRISTKLALSPDPLDVMGDSKQLQQVFTNLITNAAEAMVGNGALAITTDEDSSGSFVVAKVRDNGRGIAKSNLDRVFEPFFTTKGRGKGTGLGLSVSLGIVRRHGGTIDIESAENEGTTVTVTLPRALDGQERTGEQSQGREP